MKKFRLPFIKGKAREVDTGVDEIKEINPEDGVKKNKIKIQMSKKVLLFVGVSIAIVSFLTYNFFTLQHKPRRVRVEANKSKYKPSDLVLKVPAPSKEGSNATLAQSSNKKVSVNSTTVQGEKSKTAGVQFTKKPVASRINVVNKRKSVGGPSISVKPKKRLGTASVAALAKKPIRTKGQAATSKNKEVIDPFTLMDSELVKIEREIKKMQLEIQLKKLQVELKKYEKMLTPETTKPKIEKATMQCPPCPPCPPCPKVKPKKIELPVQAKSVHTGPKLSYAPPPDVVVLSTFIGPMNRTALLLLKNGRRIVVEEGSPVGRWKVASIQTDRIVLEYGRRQFAIPVTVNVDKFDVVSYERRVKEKGKNTEVKVPGFYTGGKI